MARVIPVLFPAHFGGPCESGTYTGPEHITRILYPRLRAAGYTFEEVNLQQLFPDLFSHPWQHSREEHPVHNFAVISDICERARKLVGCYLKQGAIVLVLGGDHCWSYGTVAGALDVFGKRLRVTVVDAHPDINTAETSPSGNFHGMHWRYLLDQGILMPSQLQYIGLSSIDPEELRFLGERDISRITLEEIREMDIGRLSRIIRPSIFLPQVVSYDADAENVPGVYYRNPKGLTSEEGHQIALTLAKVTPVLIEVMEVDRTRDEETSTAERMSKRIMILLEGAA